MVIVDRIDGPNRQLIGSDVEVHHLSGNHLSRSWRLRKLLRRWRAEVLFARLGLCPLIAVLASLGASADWRTIISYHNPFDPNTSRGVRLTWWSVFALSRFSSATFGVSNDIRDELVRYGALPERCRVIYNPIDLKWVNESDLAPLPSMLPENRRYILSVGRLVTQKGFHDLIEAFKLVAPQVDVDLVIAGEGPLELALRSAVSAAGLSDRVHFTGYVENPFPMYRNAALFVLASHWEGFGNVIVEALSCGAPVVCTDCPGGPKDILDNGRFGVLVPVHDPVMLSSAIVTELGRVHDREKSISRAYDFRLDAVADQYELITNL